MSSVEEQSVLEKGGLETFQSIHYEDGPPTQGQQPVEFPEGGLTGWSVVFGGYVVTYPFMGAFPFLTLPFIQVDTSVLYYRVCLYAPRSSQSTDKYPSAMRMVTVHIRVSRIRDKLRLILMNDVDYYVREYLDESSTSSQIR